MGANAQKLLSTDLVNANVYYPLITCFTDLGMTRNFVRFLENPPSPYFEGNAAG